MSDMATNIDIEKKTAADSPVITPQRNGDEDKNDTHDQDASDIVVLSRIASWARWVPGPSPQYCFSGLSPVATRWGVVLIGCWIFFLSGLNVAMMGSVSSTPGYLAQVGLTDGSGHTQLLVGTINSIYWVGVMVGSLAVGWFSDRVGRRRAVVCAGLYGIVIVPIFASLQNFGWALALRLLNGLFTGAFDSVGLNWCAESVDSRYRGLAIGLQLVCAASGASISFFLVYGLTLHATGEVIWRTPLAFQLVFVFLVMSMVFILPESPRWLVKVGYVNEARVVLARLKAPRKGEEYSQEVLDAVDADMAQIQGAIVEEHRHQSSSTYWSMFTARDRLHTARRTWTALLIQFGTQAMIGVGVVTAYGIKIFETGGWASDIATLLSGIGIVTQATFGVAGAMMSDRIGRRRAMIYGAIIGSVLLFMVGMCGYFVDKNKDTHPLTAKAFGGATVGLILAWSAVFGMTWRKSPKSFPRREWMR